MNEKAAILVNNRIWYIGSHICKALKNIGSNTITHDNLSTKNQFLTLKYFFDKGTRAGDADILFADASKANKVLEWKAKYTDLDIITKSAWNWQVKSNS